MLQFLQGDLIGAEAEALVNTVNTVGVMGKGVALQFRKAFPDNYVAYRRACDRGEVRVGTMFVFEREALLPPRFIINFPTKEHWRAKSKLEHIEQGLVDLVAVVKEEGISSIAIPPLGCGNGGLEWQDVRPLIENAFARMHGVRVLIHEPGYRPAAAGMRDGRQRPRLTTARSALLALLDRYINCKLEAAVTHTEVQKLVYLLLEWGHPFRITFSAGEFGPYAEEVRHMLRDLDGHQIHGYGDGTPPFFIRLDANAVAEAERLLERYPDHQRRLDDVISLIEGFEDVYGLELLATVHMVGRDSSEARTHLAHAVRAVHSWTPRKEEIFPEPHIEVAWRHLRAHDWPVSTASA